MKAIGITSTCALALLLAMAAPLWAQEQHEQEQKEKSAQQEEKKAQPEKSAKPEAKGAAQQQKAAKPEAKKTEQARPGKPAQQARGNRIPDDRFKANFGQQHTFHVSQGDYRNHRFQYGGYSFGFVDAWPSNWLYTQNVYVIEINGVYYLCNAMYPGVNIALSIAL
jgi:flagellar biosynthesis component FlhA